MINTAVLVGRLTKDIDLRKTPSNISTCSFTLACDRRFKDQNGQTQADFIQCVAWRQSADYLAQYAIKGGIIGVEGSIQTRNYDGQNGKVYVTEIICNSVKLIGKHKDNQQGNVQPPEYQQNNGYQPQNNSYPQQAYNPQYPPQNGFSSYPEQQPQQQPVYGQVPNVGYQQTLTGDGRDVTGFNSTPSLEISSDDLPFY